MSVTSQQQIGILHVDDEPDFADLTGTFLEREDDRFTVETATGADQGLESIIVVIRDIYSLGLWNGPQSCTERPASHSRNKQF